MIGLHPYTGRDNAVPCQELGCRRMTWNDSALCDRHDSAVRADSASPLAGNAGAVFPPAAPATSPRHPSEPCPRCGDAHDLEASL